MSATTIAPIQPTLFDLAPTYTEADRVADRALCRSYLKQWAGSFKTSAVSLISFKSFEAASARLAL